ncbi:ATP-binding protein [Streptomyces sp. NBC_00073]
MSELTGSRIRTTAGKLGLPHLAETINEFTRRADEAKMGYLDFLDLVLSEELAVRDDRRFRQGLRLSRLPHHKTFQRDLDPRKVERDCKESGVTPDQGRRTDDQRERDRGRNRRAA